MMSKIISLLALLTLCISQSFGQNCTNLNACNFNPSATFDDGSCLFPGNSCDDGDPATQNDTFQLDCECAGFQPIIYGCLDPLACNFNPQAQVNDGSCLIVGSVCHDNNDFTFGDTVNSDCECEGQYQVQLNMFDMGGDGWTGTQLSILNADGVDVGNFELSSGNQQSVEFMLSPGCYEFVTTEDLNPVEVSFTLNIFDGNGSEDIYGLSNDSQTFSVGGRSGCTNPEAINYDEEAECENGTCFVCGVDGECDFINGAAKAKPCFEVEICGAGSYKILGTGYSGIKLAGSPCISLPISNPPAERVVRIKPNLGEIMSVKHSGNIHNSGFGGQTECIRIKDCIVVPFDWPNQTKAALTMYDDCGNGWEDIRYIIYDQDYNVVAEGTLTQAQFGDQQFVGRDELDLPDGCYQLEFVSDSSFYPGLRYELDAIDQGTISGEIPTSPIFFSRNSELCTFGCTDQTAVNFDPEATVPCFGDNGCCDYIPDNNNCEEPRPIVAGIINDFDHTYADESPFKCDPNQGADSWYIYHTLCEELVTVSGNSEGGIIISVYEGMCPSSDDEVIACSLSANSTVNEVTFFAEANMEYYIQVASDNAISTQGQGQFRIDSNGCLGCTNPMAYNYDENATLDNGSCLVVSSCAGDLNGDSAVTAADLTIFLGSYGENCSDD